MGGILVLQRKAHAVKHGSAIDDPHATKPSDNVAKVLNLHLSSIVVRFLFLRNEGLQTTEVQQVSLRCGTAAIIRQILIDECVELLFELLPLDLVLTKEVLLPEFTGLGVGDGSLNEDLIEPRVDLFKIRPLVRVGIPGVLQETLQRRKTVARNGRSLPLNADGLHELIIVAVMREELLAGDDLPQGHTERVYVSLLVERLTKHDLQRVHGISL